MTSIDVRGAKTQLSTLLARVEAGESIVLASQDPAFSPFAELELLH